MGDRGQVLMKNEKVYLYTHWGASELIKDVEKAIAKRVRWDDEEYLARIIFDEMIGKNKGEETGFGIGGKKHGDIWRLITVDCDNETITVDDNDKNIFNGDFEEFLKWAVKLK
jgi:hypothetical protein